MKLTEPRANEPIRLVLTKSGVPRYRVTLDVDPHPDGRRRQIRSTHSTLTQAREHVAAHRTDRRRGVLLAPTRETFAAYASSTWLNRRRRSPKVRAKTALSYEWALRLANASFGSMPIATVTRSDIEKLIFAMADAGRALSTVRMVLFVIRSVFEDAIEDGLASRNPAKNVRPVGRKAVERSVLSAADIRTLKAHLKPDRLYACWLLTLCGLRRSEVMGLRWSDGDLVSGTIAISRGRVLVDGNRTMEGKPKTERGARMLPLPADVLTALGEMQTDQVTIFGAHQGEVGYLAIDEAGRPMRPDRWSATWLRECHAAGVPGVTLHAARHSSVTAMRDAGVPDHVVAAWHGHDEYIMRKTYSHARAEGLAAAGRALDELWTSPSEALV